MVKNLLLLLFPCTLFAFELAPWFTPLAEFNLRSSYSYRKDLTPWPSRPHNQGQTLAQKKNFSDQLFGCNLGVRFLPNWDGQIETHFCERHKSFYMQWIGAQVRRLIMNDVAGDPLSLTVGGQISFVRPSHGVLDPYIPRYPRFSAELGLSAGKEIATLYHWRCRGYAFLGLGIHTFQLSALSLRPLLCGQIKYGHQHQLEVFAQGYFDHGYDPQEVRDQNRLKKSHLCIDAGVGYSYLFEIWGSLGIRYTHRLYAKHIPSKHLKMLTVEYRLPFSIF